MKTFRCVLVILLLLTWAMPAMAGFWQIETIGAASSGWISLALDASGNPRVSYVDSGGVKYAAWDGSSWTKQSVAAKGYFTSLALDGSGNSYICYSDNSWSNSGFNYASWNGSAWQSVKVNAGGGDYLNLAMDSQGRPHVGYSSGFSGIGHAVLNGASWQIETQTTKWAFGTSMVLDDNDQPHMSCAVGAQVGYAARGDSGWQMETLSDTSHVDDFSSLALDAAGRPGIAVASNGLKYYAWDGSAWQEQAVDSEKGWYPSLKMDPQGRACIAYWDISDGLKFARQDGSTWQVEMVEAGRVGQYTSLALDQYGNPHICYYDDLNGTLKYAQYVPEPTSLSILAAGCLMLVRRNKKRS